MSTWEPGAVSMVLMQQLGHLTSSVGGLLPRQLLDEAAPLLMSCEELSAHLSPSWSLVWPVLLEHIRLMLECGSSTSELAATFTPALVYTDDPTQREKACLQLLSILEGEVKGLRPPAGVEVRGDSHSLSEGIESQPSLKEEVVNGHHANGKISHCLRFIQEP